MPGQQRITRLLDSKPVTDNAIVTFDLGRNYDVEGYLVRLSCAYNVTTAGAAVRAESPSGLVKQFTLQAEGRTTMLSVPGNVLAVAPFDHRNVGLRTPPTGFAIASYNVVQEWFIDRSLVSGIRPKDSAFRTENLNILQLRAQIGTATDLLTGTPVGSITSGTLSVAEVALQELRGADGKRSVPQFMQKVTSADYPVTASNTNFQIPLPVGNYLRAVMFRASLSGEPSDAVINNIIVSRGQDVRWNLPYLMTRQANRGAYGISMPAGYAVADFCNIGQINGIRASDAWNLRGGAETKATLDVTTGTNASINVTTFELVRL